MPTRSRLALALLAGLSLLPRASAQVTYTLVDIGAAAGVTNGTGAAINSSGQVAFYGVKNSAFNGFVWSNGTITNIGSLGGGYTQTNAINDSGQVVGYSNLPGNGSWHAFVYTPGSGMVDLGTLGTGTHSAANGINNAGQVVGYSYTTPGTNRGDPFHAFVYTPGGVMVDLGSLGSGNSQATSINTAGQIVGFDSLNYQSPFLYSGGQWSYIPNSGTFIPLYPPIINDAGAVLISGYDNVGPSYPSRGAIYSGNSFVELPSWGGDLIPNGMNNAGQVVGTAFSADGQQHAFLYSSGQLYDLSSLIAGGTNGLTLLYANGINDSGQIVVTAQSPTLGSTAVLLTPVLIPEQSAWATLVGVVALGFVLVRRGIAA